MKVGVISRGSPDYLIDIVTDGLIRLLGRQNVCLDYNVRSSPAGSYEHLLRGFQGPEPFNIYDADVLIASIRSLPALDEWRRRTKKKAIAVVDGEDGDRIADQALYQVRVYFKREYLKNRAYIAKIKPLPFAAIPEERPENVVRNGAVFYCWHSTHHCRNEYSSILASMGFPIAAKLPKAQYNKSLASSLIGVAVRGNGWDTYRYWETPYFGAAMLAQQPGIVIPGNFIDGQEAVFFDGPQDFRVKLKGMLQDRDKTLKIASAGAKASLTRHVSTCRAKTVLEALS